MARPVLALVQNPPIKQILHDRVRVPNTAADAEEHDLLALGSGCWDPVSQTVQYGFVTYTVDVAGDPQHAVM